MEVTVGVTDESRSFPGRQRPSRSMWAATDSPTFELERAGVGEVKIVISGWCTSQRGTGERWGNPISYENVFNVSLTIDNFRGLVEFAMSKGLVRFAPEVSDPGECGDK